jgi:hypothetical protein
MNAVERAISASGHVVVDMEDFPAADQPAAKLCAERVRSCDVYIGLLGTRYGALVRGMPEVSYTELEFNTATEAGLDRLVFVLDIDAPQTGVPLSVLIDGSWTRQEGFRRRVMAEAGLATASFADPAALGQLVERSLRSLAASRRPELSGSGYAGQLAGSGLLGFPPAIGEPGSAHTGSVSAAAALRRLAGWPLSEVRDPFALEVHRSVELDVPRPGLPLLPVYVSREHDAALAEVVTAAATGTSGIAVLVGESSTGKTRACWQALELLRGQQPQWRLCHPIDPSPAAAALRELPRIGPRTVLWLNEAQRYLDAGDRLGEQVAAGLRELLRDPARAPVLVLATLWREHWDALTAPSPVRPDPHAQARELLTGHSIPVPDAFTSDQARRLGETGDERLAVAAGAKDGQVTQFLAGAPVLLARYENAPPAARALINAAMDASRLGMHQPLPSAFLDAAAPGYLTGTEYERLAEREDWLEQALAYTAAPCNGVRGPLTRWPRPSRAAVIEYWAGYRLADYLDQHGRRARSSHIPPTGFWTAAASFADDRDLGVLAGAAYSRGLLLEAARLRKLAAARGDALAAASLIRIMHSVHPGDDDPARWAAAHAALDSPAAVARLLEAFRETGAGEQVTALADRAAAYIAVDDASAVHILADVMREAGASEQAAILTGRAPEHPDPDNLGAIRFVLEAGGDEPVTFLRDRDPASLGFFDDPHLARRTLDTLQVMCAGQETTVLADRAAAQAVPGNLSAAGFLLGVLHEAAAEARGSRGAVPDDASAVGKLLGIRWEGVGVHFTYLYDSEGAVNPGYSALSRLYARVLHPRSPPDADVPRRPKHQGASITGRGPGNALADLWLHLPTHLHIDHQVITLLESATRYAALDESSDAAFLLELLREAGADQQVAVLLGRDPAAHVALDNPYGIARLLGALRETDADRQVSSLIERLPAGGLFGLFLTQGSHRTLYRFGRQPDGTPAPRWGWEDLD